LNASTLDSRVTRIVSKIETFADKHANWVIMALVGISSTLLGLPSVFDNFPLQGCPLIAISLFVLAIALLVEYFRNRVKKSTREQLEASHAAELDSLTARFENRQAIIETQYNDEITAIEEQHSRFTNVLSGIATAIAAIPNKYKDDRVSEFERIATQVVDAIVFVAHKDVPGVRAVVYQVVKSRNGAESLKVVDFQKNGRRMEPKSFDRGTARGDKAFEVLRLGQPVFVDSISNAPESWKGSGADYNTFITVPIVADKVGLGLLTVDAPETDDLTEDDENDLCLAAGLLAIAFAESQRRTPGRKPQTRDSA